jgi:hypothetical protein
LHKVHKSVSETTVLAIRLSVHPRISSPKLNKIWRCGIHIKHWFFIVPNYHIPRFPWLCAVKLSLELLAVPPNYFFLLQMSEFVAAFSIK